MLQLMESFDVFGIGDYAKRGWSGAFSNVGLGRFGVGQSMSATNLTMKATRGITSNTVYIQCGFKTSASGEIVVFQGSQGGSPQFAITYTTVSGVFKCYRGDVTGTLVATSPSTIFATGAWQFISAKIVIDSTVGLFEIGVNGSIIATVSSLNTLATSSTSIDAVGFGSSTAATWDDFICFDNSSASPNTYIGDQRIDGIFPAADGVHTDFTPSAGTSHFSLVDETTPNASDEIHSSTVGAIDTFDMSNISTGAIITAVQINAAAFKDSADSRAIATVIRRGTTDYVGDPAIPLLTESYISQIYEMDPSTGVAFLVDDLNGAQLGAKVTS